MTLIVKKGMVFGIDGILLKESKQMQENVKLNDNPEAYQSNKKQKTSTRIYTARTIGKTELYCIKKEVL